MENKFLILKCSQQSLTLPKIQLGPFSTIKASGTKPTIPLIQVRSIAGEKLIIQTEVFHLNNSPSITADGQLLFISNAEEAITLFSVISEIETELNKRLPEAVPNLKGLPNDLRKQLTCTNPLRPTYNKEGVSFYREAADCSVFNWTGTKRVEKTKLGRGDYQLLLRAHNIYVGRHRDNFPASVQLKVMQIRYKPTSEVVVHLPEKFLFEPNSWMDYTVNNIPDGQQMAIDLGLLMSSDEDDFVTPQKQPASVVPSAPKKCKRLPSAVEIEVISDNSLPHPTPRKRKNYRGKKVQSSPDNVIPFPSYSPASPMKDDSADTISD